MSRTSSHARPVSWDGGLTENWKVPAERSLIIQQTSWPCSYLSFLLQLHYSHFTFMSLAAGPLCFYLFALQFVLVCKHFFHELFHSSVLLQMRSHDTQELFITFTFHLPPAPPSSLLPTLKKSVLCCSKTLLLFQNRSNTKSSGDEKKYQLDIERASSSGDLIWMHEKCDSLPC